MATDVLFPIVCLIAFTAWLVIAHAMQLRRQEHQQQIARSGASCQGKVIGIQRPFMLNPCTRFYFDFEPVGAAQPIRACHVYRGSAADAAIALPHAGAVVNIQYLPDAPRRAVISKLV